MAAAGSSQAQCRDKSDVQTCVQAVCLLPLIWLRCERIVKRILLPWRVDVHCVGLLACVIVTCA